MHSSSKGVVSWFLWRQLTSDLEVGAIMRSFLIIAASALLSSCGKSSVDNVMVGQARRLMTKTPLICPNSYSADIFVDGVNTTDDDQWSRIHKWISIPDKEMYDQVKATVGTGAQVKITYDVRRFTYCTNEAMATQVEVLGSPAAPKPAEKVSGAR